MQIVIILRKILNLNCLKYVQWAYYNFPNTFNCYVATQMLTTTTTNKTINGEFFSANFSELSNFSSSSFWEKPLWNQKLLLLTATARRSCYITSKTFPNVELFSVFLQTFLELIFATKIKTMLLFSSYQEKYCIYYVSERLKYC